MITSPPCSGRRPHEAILETDLVIAGGGLAGTCAAITAARAGIRVVLIQDRPVLGGNASSEVRLWILGATSHMGNNNRWAREGGVIDEILVENLYRNPEGNPLILDTILLEKVIAEANVHLLLNTAVHDLEMSGPGRIAAVRAWCSQNSTTYLVKSAPVLRRLGRRRARIPRRGRVSHGRGEPRGVRGRLCARSILRRTAGPLALLLFQRHRPSGEVHGSFFRVEDITRIPRYRDIQATDSGCRFWWFEYGGRLDTVHETEAIKWELWKVAYGVWDYIKNSGRFPEAETMTLEWVGTIPGKRESRRFEGDYMLTQQDIVGQRRHDDAVGVGGWAMDLHPADGVYSELSSCTQWHSKGVYQIPYRWMYSRNIDNLFLAGRIISVSHVAFGSTRVMATCAHNGQAVGMAAAVCREQELLPRDLLVSVRLQDLQRRLLAAGQYIPHVSLADPRDLARQCSWRASSRSTLGHLPADAAPIPLDTSRAMLLPVGGGLLPAVRFLVDAPEPTTLEVEVRGSSVEGNFTLDVALPRNDRATARNGTGGLDSARRSRCQGRIFRLLSAAQPRGLRAHQ